MSVVVPAYNSAWSIRETLLSIIGQTLPDLEIIVVDDGSTDNLTEVLKPFLEAEPRLRVVRQENGGLAAARNRGMAEAAADFVAFLDADDLWHPRFLEKIVGALAANPEAPFGYAHSVRIDTHSRIIPTPRWRHSPRHDFIGLIEVNSVGSGSASVFRRSLAAAEGGFDTSFRVRNAHGAEDWKLLLTLAAKHPPVLVAEQLVAYRLVPSGMSRGRPDIQLRGIHAVLNEIRRAHPETKGRHFRNAVTVMNGWLLSAFFARRMYRRILPMLWESYVLNPLCFLSRDVREIHVHKLLTILQDRKPRLHLSELVEDDHRPFAFLAQSPVSPEWPANVVAAPERPEV